MFHLVRKLGENVCHRCSREIETVEELSIEHKQSWQLADDPVAAFFAIDNLTFSHLLCNIKAGATPTKVWANGKERQAACVKRTQTTRVASTKRWRARQREAGLPYS